MSQRCAIVDKVTLQVVNVIVADPERDAVRGALLVAIPDGMAVDGRWVLNENSGELQPNAELAEELAKLAAVNAARVSENIIETDIDAEEVHADPGAVLDAIERGAHG
jgi:hypothetical protein